MPSISPHSACSLALLGLALAGCQSIPVGVAETPPRLTLVSEPAVLAEEVVVPVLRRSRYTLVELVPEPAQRDLMRQVVETSLPPQVDATVGDAMRHVLRRSGYRLCGEAEAAPVLDLPLPASHLHIGPLLLGDALQLLAGPAWHMDVDHRNREICFRPCEPISSEIRP